MIRANLFNSTCKTNFKNEYSETNGQNIQNDLQ